MAEVIRRDDEQASFEQLLGDQDVVLPDWSLIRPLVAESFS